jgi:hypothetical protein
VLRDGSKLGVFHRCTIKLSKRANSRVSVLLEEQDLPNPSFSNFAKS